MLTGDQSARSNTGGGRVGIGAQQQMGMVIGTSGGGVASTQDASAGSSVNGGQTSDEQ